ncbi:MAG: hypothetical protein MJZ75_00980 [Paludibacteraceae bacterium]|nr:hypothetical protein [Paludibacteraceae bacterium]
MKKILFYTLAAMLLCSCGMQNFASSSSNAAPAATSATTLSTGNDGASAGRALRALYTSYKATGKYDYTDLTNIMNTISLVNSCKNLKTNAKDKAYWQSFAEGLVIGSDNLVTNQISNTVTTQLNNIVSNIDTEKIESASEKLAATKTVANDITSLFKLFQ